MTMSEIQVTLCTTENRGDHGAEVRIAHRVEAGESVDHLVDRLMRRGEFQRKFESSEPSTTWIELRVIEEPAKPEPAIPTTTEGPF